MIRVLVTARSTIARAGLESLVRASAALKLAESEDQAEVLLSDNADIEEITLPAVLLLDTADAALVTTALRSGIRGVLSSQATPEEIEAAIQAVNAGLTVLAPESLPDLLPESRARRSPHGAAQRPRTGSPRPDRRRPEQQADRPSPKHLRTHRQNPRSRDTGEISEADPKPNGSRLASRIRRGLVTLCLQNRTHAQRPDLRSQKLASHPSRRTILQRTPSHRSNS